MVPWRCDRAVALSNELGGGIMQAENSGIARFAIEVKVMIVVVVGTPDSTKYIHVFISKAHLGTFPCEIDVDTAEDEPSEVSSRTKGHLRRQCQGACGEVV